MGSDTPNKLLGLGWLPTSDELCFPIDSLASAGNTKRDLLSVISRIFDPLGLLAPCIIRMKVLLQKLWLAKLSWDEPLTPDIYKRWNDLIKSLPLLNNIRVPRHVLCDHFQTLELHLFMDASERAYGACVYIRSVNDNGEVTVRLLMAKSRVAPLKPTTIPRLELCGAVAAARLYERDCTPLTPGHFIIGRPLTAIPERDFQHQSIRQLTRFQRIEQLRQHFWTRWSKEFVAELQQRIKWRSCKDSLKLGTLVVVKEENLPPLKWRLGRVIDVHPGPDGIVRVADLKTSAGVIRRSFSKICPLPVNCGSG
ncbi:uncharacterized protein LOC126377964 [Pectinophora gossypiella]|uniref:uncharacterized protein LOC126377964 n=1 Tax=Pectinophora gossypiella TaxID=13191 RepID=UPI00214F0C57|nr:uncharacterized protein LOC126377964 [Pectinophora gossypiella]